VINLRNPNGSSSCHHAGQAYTADAQNCIQLEDSVDPKFLFLAGFVLAPVVESAPEPEVPVEEVPEVAEEVPVPEVVEEVPEVVAEKPIEVAPELVAPPKRSKRG